eukprot:CAMPEP_0196750904 /NCGR_PEP_ID=MMETSP1091-20130531/82036_1 /TAXON_ID=302021 /ORGANISM="Rhodomonas sp., Strain CCMP768" /LENGTH=47 /DNA_ID= /DNA_START= /DNA_END= /DNA_ORIENTATION=
MAARSYECPSMANTGSVITSKVIGHVNLSGGSWAASCSALLCSLSAS